MKRILFAISTLCLLFGVANSQPPSISTPDLKGEVIVRRDARAIPYIAANSDADLYYAQGYVTAGDRLWQMDLLRRVARGETAEIFGKATLEEDKRWRRFGFAKISDESIAFLSPELRVALDAYARGVNAYIATLDDKSLPIEFRVLQYKPRPWTASDSIVVGKILADALSSTWRNDLLRASLQTLPKEKIADLTNQVTPYDVVLFGKDERNADRGIGNAERATPRVGSVLAEAQRLEDLRKISLERVGLYAEELAASNNWVISGKRTADGKPLLANDPHLQPSAPGIWYLTHLSTPSMRASGVTFPGVPGIVLGHNENIAWGATNVGPDVQDLYVETFEADGKYKTPTGWAAPVTRREEIKVRSNPLKPDTEVVALDVVETRNGPIILDEGGKKYALKWTARDPKNNEFEAFYFLNRASDWNGFKKALGTYGGATQNFVYADVKGNIGWYAAGRIPIRKVGDGAMPYDGASSDGEWIGSIPFDELPHLYNPAEGFIVTANQRIVGTSYKYTQVSRDAAPPWRARRIYDLLKANSKVTMDDVTAIQRDVLNIPLLSLAKEIVAQNGASAETIAELKTWDGRMTPDSKAALIINEVRGCLALKMADENKPAPAFVIRERVLDWAIREKSARWLPKQFADYPTFLKACDAEANAAVVKRYGSDPAKLNWGSAFVSRFPHPLAVAPLIGGQFATPNVPIAGSGQTPNVGSAVSMRHVASPGNWDATRHVIPLGQSGDPKSPHYKDQFELWHTGAAAVFPFTLTAVQKATTVEVTFTPATRP
ncbi:MAG TPA: penicillin acylase family protein [Pyrinomonadaceae bacterium]|nr:penicillin acylase family protein [Pyrinomonadaceae bacterium]